jgi:hypothetical protein
VINRTDNLESTPASKHHGRFEGLAAASLYLGAMAMRLVLSVTAATIFLIGLVWQCGRWLFRWSGHSLGLRDVPGRTNSFIESFLANDVSLAWTIGPWLLMSVGIIAWLVLHSRRADAHAQGD